MVRTSKAYINEYERMCLRCRTILPLEMFYKRQGEIDSCCKRCVNMRRRAKRQKEKNIEAKQFAKYDFVKGTKTCTKCKKEQPFAEFSPDKIKKAGLSSWCRKCTNEWARNYYKTNLEARREKSAYAKKRYNTIEEVRNRESARGKVYILTEIGRAKSIARSQKRMALKRKQKGVIPSGYIEKILLKAKKCPLCKGHFNSKRKKNIDHVIPLSMGGEHTASNLQVLCAYCNISKSNKILYLC